MGNITRRKQLRQAIRNGLGVGRDEAPTTEQILRAARDLDEMLRLTSGNYRLEGVIDRRTAERLSATEALGREISARREGERLRSEAIRARLEAGEGTPAHHERLAERRG